MLDDLPTQRIARWSNRRRDEYMLDRLLDAFHVHRRVFATVGVTHAVMLEPALRAAMREAGLLKAKAFGWSSVREQWRNVYERATSK